MSPMSNETLDRLLRKTLRGAKPAGECPDAETLAAWWDRSLSRAEHERWESHFSSCSRCQAELAALAHVSPQPSRASAGAALDWLSRWVRIRWAAPVAVAATAVLALSVVIRNAPPPIQETRVEQGRGAAEKSADAAPRPAPMARELAPAPAAPMAQTVSPRQPAPSPRAFRTDLATRAAKSAEARKAPAVPQPEKHAKALALQDEAPRREQGEKEEAIPQAAPEERSRAGEADAMRAQAAPSRDRAAQPMAEGVAGAASPSSRVAYASVAAAPGGQIRWRVGAHGVIERSSDAGATWAPQQTNVGSDLLAASAPGDSVCWVVGRAGVVLRTIDGATWERLASPAGDDLVAVVAHDASSARVRTANGLELDTADGGRSWQAIATVPPTD